MRRYDFRFWAFAALAAGCAISVSAAPVDEAMAKKAIGAWRARGGVLGLKMGHMVRDVRRVERDGAAFHVVRFEGGGMAISPTDTTIRPVILVSEEDDFDENPDNPAWDLLVPELAARARQNANRKMQTAAPAAVRKSDCEAEWADLLSGLKYDKVGDDAIDDVRVGSFVNARWDQGSAGGGRCYNYYTPGNHVCGCVATAMAQAMRYFEYPASTTEVPQFTNRRCSYLGTQTEYTTQGGFYDWSLMPYVPSSGMSEEERQAIGKLTSDLGIMLGSNYNSGGTGAVSPAVQYVFTKCLGYANAISIEYMDGRWSGLGDEYQRMLISNFDAKLPVVISLANHEIVGDGYGYRNGNLYYHLNFGWSGAAWYRPTESMEGYYLFYGAIFNIYTTRDGNPEIASGRVTDADGRPVKGLTVIAAKAATPDEVVATAVTDDNGIYAAFVPPGDYRLSAEILYEDGEGHYFGTFDATVGKSASREVFVDPGLRTIGGVSTEFPMPYSLWHGTPACTIGNAAQCDIQLKGENFDPAATVAVSGPMTVGTDFAVACVPVTAQVSCYGNVYSVAQVTVTLTPGDGGKALTRAFTIAGDKDPHDFTADFDGIVPGMRYTVEARVMMGGSQASPSPSADPAVVAARSVEWIAESAATFPGTGWTVGDSGARAEGGWIVLAQHLADTDKKLTYTASCGAEDAEVILRLRTAVGVALEMLASYTPGCAGVTLVETAGNVLRFAVWGNGRWNVTDVAPLATGDEMEYEAKLTINRSCGKVGYQVRPVGGEWVDLGTYEGMTGGESRTVEFAGTGDIATMDGVRFDPNLVVAADGTEFADFTSAVAAGAVSPLSPLWWSTWNLTGGSGSLDIRDPSGYITFTGESKVVKTEKLPDGSERKWYAELPAGGQTESAAKYIKTTVNLGLAKAITDESVVRIGDYLVTDGAMSFSVAVDDVTVAKKTVMDLVEVKAKMSDAWGQPDPADIDFKDGKVIVIPNRGGASGFVRVRIPEEK